MKQLIKSQNLVVGDRVVIANKTRPIVAIYDYGFRGRDIVLLSANGVENTRHFKHNQGVWVEKDLTTS